MPRLLLCCLILLGFARAPALAAGPEGAFAFDMTAIEGTPMPLADFAGHPVLVVNTATQCGFTPQLDGLQALYDRYRDRGFVVLAVPSNDFGGQEPGSNAEIKTFCEANFNVDFPMSEKSHVKGPDSHPLFGYFRSHLGDAAGPGWNFYKYLVAPDGQVVGFWPSKVEPDSTEITQAIERLLPPAS